MPRSASYVWVYDYEYWDPDTSQMVTSGSPATLEAIRDGLGMPILTSGRKVPRTFVNAQGRARAPTSSADEEATG